ncbi:hypothetical protein OG729_34325 [Streptomyces sp. NBC_00210]|uniref:hypothetical protein n=1 Tax=unclassified Streptomyces TaxID=2593676 RepID=UPI00324F99B2
MSANKYYNPDEQGPNGARPALPSPAAEPSGPGPVESVIPPPAETPPPAAPHWAGPPSAPAPPVPPAPTYESPQHANPVPDGNLEPLRIPMRPQGSSDGAPDPVRIGLWGAPRSGKTTYLAALPIAAMQYQRHGRGNWVVSGMTKDANDFLVDNVARLTRDRVFPDATTGMKGMSWSFQGEEPASGAFRTRGREVDFVLEIHDPSGEVFRRDHPQHAAIIDQLARAKGLIYIFDPLGDAVEATQSLNFFHAALTELNTRVRDSGGHIRNRLPHHVSVCVAKFDHPEVFRPAVEAGWVTQDSVGSQLPRVPERLGADFFGWMCNDFRGATARLVRDALASFFHPENISYYASSAIGFRLNPQHVFDYRNYANVEIVEGQRRICTSPEPINVLEPLIDLERRIRTGKRKGGKRR